MEPNAAYVCFVSDNLLPNIIPLVDPATRPRDVVLIVTQGYERQAKWFMKATEGWGMAIQKHPGFPYSYEKMHSALEQIAREYKSIVINVTGGTKLMALAGFAIGQGRYPVMYVDSRNQRIQYLGGQWHDMEWPANMRVKQYLASYGYTLESKGESHYLASWREVGNVLVTKSFGWHKGLHALNWEASQRTTDWRKPFSISLQELAQTLVRGGLIEAVGPNQWRFVSEEARAFLNGGWFEGYVMSQLRAIQKQLRLTDLLSNVVISKENVRNELDIVFMFQNRLHIIECKTKNFDRDGELIQSQPVY
ncbi:MAG: hypothetical protein C7B44_10415, partial [Sulfobacillus thermosulfidooxidans]